MATEVKFDGCGMFSASMAHGVERLGTTGADDQQQRRKTSNFPHVVWITVGIRNDRLGAV
jgi:hypothetical protein